MPPTEEDIAWFKSTFHPIPKPALPDDCIEYYIYVVNPKIDHNNDSEARECLKDVQKFANDLQKKYLKDYLWQRQSFGLELQKADGISFLRGQSEYGDSIEDEWVITWLLRELSKKFANIWVKVTDNDGEFLLIEASGTLPSWLEPDVAENRVWINNGQLKIIKPAANVRSSKRTMEKLSLTQAQQIILSEPKRLMHSISMEEEAFYRLRNYPAQIQLNMHHAMVRIPRKVAFLLKQKPAYITPAVEAFYLRDPISLKPLQSKDATSKLIFSPNDLVDVSIRFPRVTYAQLKSQHFIAPSAFSQMIPNTAGSIQLSRAEVGMKISVGFEMLLTDPQYQDRPAVREMKLVLEDLVSGDEILPTDEDISQWPQQQDDEKWLDIDFGDLEQELDSRGGVKSGDKKPEFGDKAAQENLQKIVLQFEKFLNDDTAGPEGADLFAEDSSDEAEDSDDEDVDEDFDGNVGEDKDASFDEDEFSRMMQEMMGMPAEVMNEIMKGNLGSSVRSPQTQEMGRSGTIDELDSTDEDESAIDAQLEAELRAAGVLDLDGHNASTSGPRALRSDAQQEEPDISSVQTGDSQERSESARLAYNLLQSFKAQGGSSGPSSNLIGVMGHWLPRDEDDNVSADARSKVKNMKS